MSSLKQAGKGDAIRKGFNLNEFNKNLGEVKDNRKGSSVKNIKRSKHKTTYVY